MKPSSGDTILIGALLERLGSAQAQLLLDQIRSWQPRPNAHRETSRTERRRGETGNRNFDQNIASQTQEDY